MLSKKGVSRIFAGDFSLGISNPDYRRRASDSRAGPLRSCRENGRSTGLLPYESHARPEASSIRVSLAELLGGLAACLLDCFRLVTRKPLVLIHVQDRIDHGLDFGSRLSFGTTGFLALFD